MNRLTPITSLDAIPAAYLDTPIGRLLEYHNLGRAHEPYASAQLLIGMCMDNRIHVNIPDNFAFVIRSGGGKLRDSKFKVSYAIAVGGVRCIALIGHTDCGMVNLAARKEQFIRGLSDGAGWERAAAEAYFNQFAPRSEIGHEVECVLSECARLHARYPKILVAPFIYRVEDNRLYGITKH